MGLDDSIQVYPLSDASEGTAAYNTMIPMDLHYEASSDTLILVTRGSSTSGKLADFYEITALP